jgi:hypothetical protein
MGAPFANCFTRWIQSVFKATDGDNHMVIAWRTVNGVVLGQEKIAEKSNEIKTIPELLNSLAIKGCIITINAMGC